MAQEEPKLKKQKLFSQQKLSFFCPKPNDDDKSDEPQPEVVPMDTSPLLVEKSEKSEKSEKPKKSEKDEKLEKVEAKKKRKFQAKWVQESAGLGRRSHWLIYDSEKNTMGCKWCREVHGTDPPGNGGKSWCTTDCKNIKQSK